MGHYFRADRFKLLAIDGKKVITMYQFENIELNVKLLLLHQLLHKS